VVENMEINNIFKVLPDGAATAGAQVLNSALSALYKVCKSMPSSGCWAADAEGHLKFGVIGSVNT